MKLKRPLSSKKIAQLDRAREQRAELKKAMSEPFHINEEKKYSLDVSKIEPKFKIPEIPFNKPGLPKPPFRMLMVGPSGSGKSNLLLTLITNKSFYKDYFKNRIHVFSRSITTDPIWTNLSLPIIKGSYDSYYPDALKQIIEEQEKIVEAEGKNKNNTKLIILDDCLSEIYNRAGKPGEIETCFFRARHCNVSLIVTAQSYYHLPKSLRINASCLVAFRLSNHTENRGLYNEHGGRLEFPQWKQLMQHVWSEPYAFLYIWYNPESQVEYRRGFSTVLNIE